MLGFERLSYLNHPTHSKLRGICIKIISISLFHLVPRLPCVTTSQVTNSHGKVGRLCFHLCPFKYEGVYGIAHSMQNFFFIHRLNETFPLVATTVGTVLLRFLSCGCPELLPQYIYTIANKCVNGVPFLVQNTCFKVELYQMSRYTIFRLGKLVSAKKPCQMVQSRIF